jgi:hypothetical protein
VRNLNDIMRPLAVEISELSPWRTRLMYRIAPRFMRQLSQSFVLASQLADAATAKLREERAKDASA